MVPTMRFSWKQGEILPTFFGKTTKFIWLNSSLGLSVWAATTSSLLLAAWLHYSLTDDYRFIKEPHQIYDYIIVGAGTSGCVLAAKLAAAEDGKVLVIEAGGEPPWYSWIPLIAPVLQGSTKHDWRFQTLPQKFAAGALHNNVIDTTLGVLTFDRTRFNLILLSSICMIAILLASGENGNFKF